MAAGPATEAGTPPQAGSPKGVPDAVGDGAPAPRHPLPYCDAD